MSNWARLISNAAQLVQRTLGERVMYVYSDGVCVYLSAIIDHENEEISLGIGINSSARIFVVDRLTMDRRPENGDLITHNNATFEVANIVEDGLTVYRIYTHAIDTRHAGDII